MTFRSDCAVCRGTGRRYFAGAVESCPGCHCADIVGECPRCGVRFISDRPGVAAEPCGVCAHPIMPEREPAARLFEPAPEQIPGQTYLAD